MLCPSLKSEFGATMMRELSVGVGVVEESFDVAPQRRRLAGKVDDVVNRVFGGDDQHVAFAGTRQEIRTVIRQANRFCRRCAFAQLHEVLRREALRG